MRPTSPAACMFNVLLRDKYWLEGLRYSCNTAFDQVVPAKEVMYFVKSI